MTTLEEEAPSNPSGDRPLILLVEDKRRRRQGWAKDLRELGSDVLAARDSDEALEILRDSPAIDGVIADIHLSGGDRSKDGVAFARVVRESYDDSLPLIGYSGHFEWGQLSEDELALFDRAELKGSLSAQQQRELKEECVRRARQRRASRRETAEQHRRPGVAGEFETRNLVLKNVDVDELENLLINSGFEIRLITAAVFSELVRPVPVWVRSELDLVTAQVYSQPLLHASGNTESEAIQYLIELMVGIRDDLSELGALETCSEPYRRLYEYLQNVLAS